MLTGSIQRATLGAFSILFLAACSDGDPATGADGAGATSGAGTGASGPGSTATSGPSATSGTGGSAGASGPAGAGGGGGAPYERQHLLVETTFETPDPLAADWTNQQHCCDYSVTISEEKAYSPTKAMRLELHDDDPMVSGSRRSEITWDGEEHVERWYGAAYYLEDWADDEAGESIIQWHQSTYGGSPPLGLWTTGGRFTVTRTDPDGAGSYDDAGPIIADRWFSIVFHVRWTEEADGLLEVFVDGAKVFTFSGPTAWDPTYLKVGLNKWGWTDGEISSVSKRVLHVDELRIGDELATYPDVAP